MRSAIKYLSLLTLACLVVLTRSTSPMACNCTPIFIPDLYCKADYVAVIMNMGIQFRPYDETIKSYKIVTIQKQKTTDVGNKTLESGVLFSPPGDRNCDAHLKFNKHYLVAGKGSELGACDFIKEIDSLTDTEEKVFKGDHKDFCYTP